MLAAFIEWLLWLGAFLFCLGKVFQKAEHWSTRVIAVAMMFLFTALRYDRDEIVRKDNLC
jgi:chitin synthase